MKKVTIGEVMTPAPHTINESLSLADARELMQKYGVRHLPVLERGKLVGLLSDRDITLLETFRDVELAKATVADAIAIEPWVVEKSALLAEVAADMAERKLGSAVVKEGTHVVGIFTTVDACRVLAQMLR